MAESADEHGRFDPHDHDHQRGGVEDVLDEARAFYRALLPARER